MRAIALERVKTWGGAIPKSSKEYVIQKGDSLWSLSRQFDISVEKIREINGLESDVLSPGQILRIQHGQHNQDVGE